MSEPVSKTLGIVIRTADFRDADRVAEIFTPDGKKTVTVRGVRKQNAKMTGAAQIFTYGEYVLFCKNDRFTVTGYSHMDSFTELSTDINKYACASVILDIIDGFSFEEEESREVFLLTLRSLHTICYNDMPPIDALLFFIIKFVSITGYEPSMEFCARCGEEAGTKFSVEDGGLVCSDCATTFDYSICKGAILDIKKTISWNYEEMKRIRYSKVVAKDLYNILLAYICQLSSKRLKSVDFLRTFNLNEN